MKINKIKSLSIAIYCAISLLCTETQGTEERGGLSSQSSKTSSHLSNRLSKRVTIGSEFNINQNMTGTHYSPSVTNTSTGPVFVAWYSNQTGNNQIYGRFFDMTGEALLNEFGINQNLTGDHYSPSTKGLPNANVFIAWYGTQTGNNQIYGRIFAVTGTATANEFGINQNTTGDHYNPSVAVTTNGNVFVAWYGDQTGDFGIYGRVFSSTGTAVSSEFQISQNNAIDQRFPTVVSLPNGNVFIAYTGDLLGNFNVYGRLFDSNGNAISNAFNISSVTVGQQYSPSAASIPTGNVFVAWYGTQSGNYDVYGTVLDSAGTPLSSVFTISQNTTGYQYLPYVVGLPNLNEFFVTWYGNQSGNYEVYGRFFGTNGSANGNEIAITQEANGIQALPSAESLPNGDVFVAWAGDQTGNYDSMGQSVPAARVGLNCQVGYILAKGVMGGFRNLLNLATTQRANWKNLGFNLDETKDTSWAQSRVVEEVEEPTTLTTSHSPQPVQELGYIESWFSRKAWRASWDSVVEVARDPLKALGEYSVRLIQETPSYNNPYFGESSPGYIGSKSTIFSAATTGYSLPQSVAMTAISG